MPFPILIAISFSFGFFIESIIGFGGSLIAYSIMGFFMDIKQMVLLGLYIGTCASAYILFTDHKSFSKKLFMNALPTCLLGTMIGVLIFTKIDSRLMLSLFGVMSIILSAKVIFFDGVRFPQILRNFLLMIGGISHGLFGIGGPFIAIAIKDSSAHKSEMRATLALFFVALNIVRFVQLMLSSNFEIVAFHDVWWVVFPVFIAIYHGFKIHLKISEIFFKKMIAVMTFFAGLVFLMR